ncbi:TonB-dependent receptor domain-containing protein [Brevundimonas staleyi]|uniref:TonB-dependent receptor domain-containing protein n=1 Tax=Brevundimonas staleyi TaxID=74326 RepID=A0ABW0FV35_9CAUL
MKPFHSTLAAALLASSALVAPTLVWAQTAPEQTPPAQADAQAQHGEDTVDEIVVLGRYIPEPNRESSEVAAFLTSEDLQRTGDSDAAAALTRVTGLSIVEGRFIYVRGLGERYSSALLNGSPLPSPEPLQRVVPLDLFPTNILDSVTVQKSYSANFPGEFGGGVIDLHTVSAPNEPFFSLQAKLGGNTESTGRRGLIYYGSDVDWTGFSNTTRRIPGPLNTAFASGRQITAANYTAAQLQRIGQSLVNAPLRLLQSDTTPVDFGMEMAGGLSSDSSIGTVGVVFVGGYGNEWRNRDGIQEQGQFQGDVLVPVTSREVYSNRNDIRLNGLLGLSWSNETNEVQWTNMYVRSTTKQARTAAGPDVSAGAVTRNDFTEWYVRQLFNTQLRGEHEFMDGALAVNWRAAYALTTRDAPYETRFSYSQAADGTWLHSGGGNLISFSDLNDDLISGGVDVIYTMPLSDYREAIFSFGVAGLDNQRNSERRDLRFQPVSGGLTAAQQRARVDYLYSDFNINPSTIQILEVTGSGNGAAAYEAELQVNAAYAMVDAEIIPLVRTTVGVRFEDGYQRVRPFDLFGGNSPFPETVRDEQYWLPSATATWNFAEDQQLRVGASKTIGRPQFRELAPLPYTDPDSDREFIGNPFLVDTEIVNIDARYEWYFARQQFVTAGLFYKNLDKPVESVVVEIGNQRQQTFLNAPEARIYGAEFEVKKFFEFPDAGSSFVSNKRWLVQANYTYSQSEVNVNAGDTVLDISNGGNPSNANFFIVDGSRLQGQSEHIANLQLGWEDDDARSQATIIVNYVSDRITARGAGQAGVREPDYIQDPGVFLDFVYRKDFMVGERDFGFAFEARNLLGTEFDEYQTRGNKIRINNYNIGQRASVSLTARF